MRSRNIACCGSTKFPTVLSSSKIGTLDIVHELYPGLRWASGALPSGMTYNDSALHRNLGDKQAFAAPILSLDEGSP